MNEIDKLDEFLLKYSKITISFLGAIFLITFVCFLSVLANKPKPQGPISISPSGEKVLSISTKAETEWLIGNRLPNTTETIEIKAEKRTPGDILAFIRLRILGGDVVEVTSPYTLFQGCNGGNGKEDLKSVCVNIAKPIPFIDGEAIAKIVIKWANVGSPKIFKSSEFGYYNGSEFNSSN